jgi:hypothetical protein
MKKILAYGLAAGALAAASLIVATPAHAVPATGTASSMTVAPGGTFTATVTNATPVSPSSDNWCAGDAPPGLGLSMYVMLEAPPAPPIFIPEDTAAGALGSFSWDGSAGATASAEITIPADLAPGGYNLKLFDLPKVRDQRGCTRPRSRQVPLRSTAAEPAPAPSPEPAPAPEALPDTGQDESEPFSSLELARLPWWHSASQ